jgi:hypothetical protein
MSSRMVMESCIVISRLVVRELMVSMIDAGGFQNTHLQCHMKHEALVMSIQYNYN